MLKKILTIAFTLLLSTAYLSAQRVEKTSYEFDFAAKTNKGDVWAVTPQTIFSEEQGYGYDFNTSWDGRSASPFYFSVNVPDGNYRVTVTLGSKKKATETTVRAESRRLFVENLALVKGKTEVKTFVVNKRNTRIGDKEHVKIKPREKSKLNWDDKLTIEFNGDMPSVISMKIEQVDVPTVFLCGNSTVVDQDYEPWASWGQMITRFMTDEVAIANYAESGETADGFIARGRLKKILSVMKKGDYIFMEFGHNDQKSDDRVGHGAFYSFQHQLKIFVDEAHKRGATPILVTPTMRRKFEKGVNVNTHKDYPEAIRFMAQREGLALIDLQAMTQVLYETLGEEDSKRALVHYPANSFPNQGNQVLADNTHFNTYGAYQVAKMVLRGIEDARLPLTKYISKDFKGYSPAHPDCWKTFKWNLSPFSEIEKPDGN